MYVYIYIHRYIYIYIYNIPDISSYHIRPCINPLNGAGPGAERQVAGLLPRRRASGAAAEGPAGGGAHGRHGGAAGARGGGGRRAEDTGAVPVGCSAVG